VALAPPVIVFVVPRTCLIDITTESFAAIATAVAMLTESSAIVNVADEFAVFTIRISVTIEVVEEGTVYNRVPVFVVAAPLKRALVVVAINYSNCLINLLYQVILLFLCI
jgi:hypothetical protein